MSSDAGEKHVRVSQQRAYQKSVDAGMSADRVCLCDGHAITGSRSSKIDSGWVVVVLPRVPLSVPLAGVLRLVGM